MLAVVINNIKISKLDHIEMPDNYSRVQSDKNLLMLTRTIFCLQTKVYDKSVSIAYSSILDKQQTIQDFGLA